MPHEWEIGVENQLDDLRTRLEALEKAAYVTAQKKVEAPETIDNNARDEICSDSICQYCVHPCKDSSRNSCCSFTGRKLSHVA